MAHLTIKRYWNEELVMLASTRMKLDRAQDVLSDTAKVFRKHGDLLEGDYVVEIHSDRNWDLIPDPVTIDPEHWTNLAKFLGIDRKFLSTEHAQNCYDSMKEKVAAWMNA